MTRRRLPACLTALFGVLAALVSACARSDAGGAARPEAQVTGAEGNEVQPVPMPDLSRLPGPVQEQVRERYGVLEQTLGRRAAGEELGRAYGNVGLILMAAEYLEAAASSLRNAQALAPNDPRWPYYLGQFFTEWGVQMANGCVAGFCPPATPVAAYVNGTKVTTSPDQIELKKHEEIAIVIGTPPATIPSSFAFPSGY